MAATMAEAGLAVIYSISKKPRKPAESPPYLNYLLERFPNLGFQA
jgi:hypothetical protein